MYEASGGCRRGKNKSYPWCPSNLMRGARSAHSAEQGGQGGCNDGQEWEVRYWLVCCANRSAKRKAPSLLLRLERVKTKATVHGHHRRVGGAGPSSPCRSPSPPCNDYARDTRALHSWRFGRRRTRRTLGVTSSLACSEPSLSAGCCPFFFCRSGSFRMEGATSGFGATSATSFWISPLVLWVARAKSSSQLLSVRCGANTARPLK